MIIQCYGPTRIMTAMVDGQECEYLQIAVTDTANTKIKYLHLNKAQLKTLIVELNSKFEEMND